MVKSTVGPSRSITSRKAVAMTSDDSGAQDRRETRAAKHLEKAREGGEARADYEATQQATEDKTVRLKALRLAKVRADKEADKKVDKKAGKKAAQKK
jgi:hypothetical protein